MPIKRAGLIWAAFIASACSSPASGTGRDAASPHGGGVHSSGISAASGGPGGGAGGASAAHTTGATRSGFVHPGILVDRAMLDFVHAKIVSNAEPWASALAAAKRSPLASPSYTPHPLADVVCGPYSNPNIGCDDETHDSDAAYLQALLWVHTGDVNYAKKAVEIMNAWSRTVTAHSNSNAPLQSAWTAEVFPRAAEIIRSTYSGWAAADIAQFSSMLEKVYLPQIINGSDYNGNWELSMIEGIMNIAVFSDDKATFQKALSMWRARVPAYLYLTSDGATPVPPPTNPKTGSALTSFWYNQSTLVDGVCQETCRDLGHVQYGLAALVNAAETALIQGVDLYGEQKARLVAGLELHANYLQGAAVPAWLCGGTLTAVKAYGMWEIAVNELVTVRGAAMPKAVALVAAHRPTGVDRHMAWETLTHAQLGAVK